MSPERSELGVSLFKFFLAKISPSVLAAAELVSQPLVAWRGEFVLDEQRHAARLQGRMDLIGHLSGLLQIAAAYDAAEHGLVSDHVEAICRGRDLRGRSTRCQ